MNKRFILVARYYSIEPLGILYLAGIVRNAGWECKIVLIDEFDFKPLYDAVSEWEPQFVGFQIWTGYHTQTFAACDKVREMGASVVIGGPHATYFDNECLQHADWVIKGGAFGLLEDLLDGHLSKGLHFNKEGRKESFPLPDRAVLYDAYTEYGKSPIKSMIASVGCPFFCTYCYAPSFNDMHGGFALTMRSVDELIKEARAIQKQWPLSMVYFQDDIFGYKIPWLEEFSKLWKREIGVPFHCQIRLELTRGVVGLQRLKLLAEAGCSGITLAIESGNAFLRDNVLFRHMPDELILEGCERIMSLGMTLRTEQILAVPFSSIETELSTLSLNSKINPTMAWTSILAPYSGTDMGMIAKNFGIYTKDNDDLSESFFDKSVLRHIKDGPHDIERIVDGQIFGQRSRPLLKMHVGQVNGSMAKVFLGEGEQHEVGKITYLSEKENEQYCDSIVRLQRLFMFLSKVPDSTTLASDIIAIPRNKWSWNSLGEATGNHLSLHVEDGRLTLWKSKLACEMGLSVDSLPDPISQNPWYFIFFPEGGVLVERALKEKVFDCSFDQTLDALGTLVRRHLFHYGLYRIEPGRNPIVLMS